MLTVSSADGESIIDYPLATFPWRTPAAILLAISLISQIILTLIHTFSVVPILGFLKNRLRGLTYRDRRAASIDTQSVHQLVTHPSGPVSTSSERQGRCLYAFIAFWIISLAFATAGAAMLLDASIKVEKRGDGDADLGPSAYRKCLVSWIAGQMLMPSSWSPAVRPLIHRSVPSRPSSAPSQTRTEADA